MDEPTPTPGDLDPAARVARLEERVGYRFQDAHLAVEAITHSSIRGETGLCNERLEFLGDSILSQIVCEFLYRRFPDCEEGDLSQWRSILVSARALSDVAKRAGLSELIVVGRGLSGRKHLPQSILCNVLEAIVAAIYLDGGRLEAQRVTLALLEPKIQEILRDEHEKNYKSLLQDHAQRLYVEVPQYQVVREIGPDHRKQFEVQVTVHGRTFGPAWGLSKKEAEQNVARMALQELGLLPSEPPSG